MISLLLAIAQLSAAQPAALQVPAAFNTLPSVERLNDAGICDAMRSFAAQVSTGRAQQVAGSGRVERVTVVCAMREVSFGQAASADDADAEAQDMALDEAVCRNRAFRQIAQRGWTLSTSMTTADGQQAFRDIDCGSGSGAVSAAR